MLFNLRYRRTQQRGLLESDCDKSSLPHSGTGQLLVACCAALCLTIFGNHVQPEQFGNTHIDGAVALAEGISGVENGDYYEAKGNLNGQSCADNRGKKTSGHTFRVCYFLTQLLPFYNSQAFALTRTK
jgi:hypothetical protein